MSLGKSKMLSQGAASVPSYEWFAYVTDAGGNLTSVRINTLETDFTYSAPTGYGPYGESNNKRYFDPNNTYGSEFAFFESNQRVTKTSSGFYSMRMSADSRSGSKTYFEFEFLAPDMTYGITKNSTPAYPFDNAWYNNSIQLYNYSTSYRPFTPTATTGAFSLSNNDVIGFALDLVSSQHKVDIYKNNTLSLSVNLPML